jgi:hypothetical protein
MLKMSWFACKPAAYCITQKMEIVSEHHNWPMRNNVFPFLKESYIFDRGNGGI